MSTRFQALFRLTIAAALGAFACVTYAANLGFLHDTPASWMKDKDNASLNRAIHTALDTKNDGETMDWTNDGTGNSVKIDATVTPVSTLTDASQTCRNVTVVLRAKGQDMTLHPRFCRGLRNASWVYQKNY